MKTASFMIRVWKGIPLIGLSFLFASNLLVPTLAAQETAQAAAPAAAPAASEPPPAATGEFSTEQLEQLVAPIALYPDTLLTQILMASTYPLEIVEADRFMKQNSGLKGDALDKALLEKEWDPSIKSMCTMPDVLTKMSENLDWTQDLGDAFLGQKTELMDTVQRMRGLAYEAGNLETTKEQTVTQQEDKIIVIQQSDPEVIYVPQYNSTVVYGSSWGYPSYYYPPMYAYPPGYGLFSFSVGVAVGAAFWGGCNWGWGGSDIDIDVNRYNEFNRNTNINADRDRINTGDRGGGKAGWNHDSSHRKGVNYRSQDVAQRNGAAAGSNRVSKDQARGRSNAAAGNRASTGAGNRASTGAGNRAATGAGNRASTGASNRASTGAGNRASTGTSNRSSPSASSRSSASSRNSAYSGSRSASSDRMSSSRGASSRGSHSYGGSRGGGGARGGGGRRR